MWNQRGGGPKSTLRAKAGSEEEVVSELRCRDEQDFARKRPEGWGFYSKNSMSKRMEVSESIIIQETSNIMFQLEKWQKMLNWKTNR